MFRFMRKKNNRLLFIICSISLILAAMPFIANLLYRADDYVLLGEYNINLSTMWYNYRAYGRYIEGLLADILYKFNLSPLTKPMGIYCFIAFNVMLGIYIVEKLDVKDSVLRGAIVLASVSNPFLIEKYCYSTIPIFSGFAMLFLVMGAEAGEKIKANKTGGGFGIINCMLCNIFGHLSNLLCNNC